MAHPVNDARTHHDPYSALRIPAFRLFAAGNALSVLGTQMQSVAVGWEIYERTNSNLALGMVGLVQFFPVIALALVTGPVADRLPRKWIVTVAMAVIALCALGLAVVSRWQVHWWWMYVCLFLSGVARAFQQPAKSSLVPQLVPADRFSNAVTWNVGGFHLASVVGPAAAGLLIACTGSAAVVYAIDAVLALSFAVALVPIRSQPVGPPRGTSPVEEFADGLRFLWGRQIILAAISLDMFAVLLGGSMALLPVYAKDILQVGSSGLGWMRAAPAIGALTMSLLLAHRPPLAHAGRALLWAVAGFGIATVLFGVSRSFWLSLGMLFLTGAFDNISVVVRHTLVQILTPDEFRGRVSAVNGLFIGASNELGGFESGTVAALWGPTVSVVSGGVGTMAVVAGVALLSPKLRRYGALGSGA
jgi:MFS family permease